MSGQLSQRHSTKSSSEVADISTLDSEDGAQQNEEFEDASPLHHNIEASLYWKDLRYTVYQASAFREFFHRIARRPYPSHRKSHLLTNISGCATPGKLLAIIGSSGAGKTSLINILANQVKSGKVRGQVTVNGEPIDRVSNYRHIVSYVRQRDALLPFLTVGETLFYAGMLSLPRSMSTKEKLRRISSVTRELGLDKCIHTYVGNAIVRGVSGGERKRLSIAIEMLRAPAILLLDEPTTGLDANTSLQLVSLLKRLAEKFRYTIICSIHQPRAQIFHQFDDLLVLAPGGQQLYFGTVPDALPHFAQCGYQCPVHENPADFYLDIAAVNFSSVQEREKSYARIDDLAAAWENEGEDPEEPPSSGSLHIPNAVKGAIWPLQVFWIVHREVTNDSRNRRFYVTRFIQNFFVAFLLGWLYFRLEHHQSSISDRTGLIFWVMNLLSYNEMVASITVFISQREVLFRERDSGFYSTSAYWAGKQLALLPSQLFFPAVFVNSMYWLSGLQIVWYKFFIFFAMSELIGLYCSSLGLLLGAALSPTVAVIAGPLANFFGFFTAGFLAHLDDIVIPFRYLTYISYGRWSYDALVQNEFRGLKLHCTSSEIVNGICPFTTGEAALDQFNLTELEVWQDMLILLAFVVLFKILLYFVLRYSRPTGR